MAIPQQLGRSLAWVALASLVGGCVSGGGEDRAVSVAMPTDTYETCQGGGAMSEGVNFLSSSTSSGGGGGGGTVRLGMSECGLIQVLGDPVSVAPGREPGGRQVTMTYANPDGTRTSYTFANNALREMNLVSEVPAAAPGEVPPG